MLNNVATTVFQQRCLRTAVQTQKTRLKDSMLDNICQMYATEEAIRCSKAALVVVKWEIWKMEGYHSHAMPCGQHFIGASFVLFWPKAQLQPVKELFREEAVIPVHNGVVSTDTDTLIIYIPSVIHFSLNRILVHFNLTLSSAIYPFLFF